MRYRPGEPFALNRFLMLPEDR